eukprot:g182.t1
MIRVRRSGPEARIEKLRKYEEKMNSLRHSATESTELARIAHWETRSDERLLRLRNQSEYTRLQAEKEKLAAERRQKLKLKLAAEEEQYYLEMQRSQETPEEKRQKLAEKAARLVQLHSSTGQEAPGTIPTSIPLLKSNIQVDEKIQRKILEDQEKQNFEEMLQKEKKAKDERFLTDLKIQEEKRNAFKQTIAEQVRDKKQQNEHLRQLSLEEGRKMKEQFQTEKELEQLRLMEEASKKKAIAEEIRKLNIEQEELEYLNEVLSKERKAARKELEAKERRRKEIESFKDDLRKANEHAKALSCFYVTKQMEERERQEEAKERARLEARKQLMKEVNEGRQLQLQEKKKQQIEEKKCVEKEREWLLQEAAEIQASKQRNEQEANRKALERKLELQTQITQHAQLRAAEVQEIIQHQNAVKEAEAKYNARINQVLESDAPVWHGRKKIYDINDWFNLRYSKMQDIVKQIDAKVPGFSPCFGGSELLQAMDSLFGKSASSSESRVDSQVSTQRTPKPEALKQYTVENEVDPHMRELLYSVNRFASLAHRHSSDFNNVYHYGLLLQELAAKLRYELETKMRTFPVQLVTELLTTACEKYHEALKLRPAFHAAYYNWGVALSELSSIWKITDERKVLHYLHLASQKYSESIKLCPDNPRGLNNWGLVLQEVSNYETNLHKKLELAVHAIDKFRRAIRLRLDFDHGCYNMGTIFYTHAINLKEAEASEYTTEDGQYISPLRELIGNESQFEDVTESMMQSAAQYICLAAAIESTNKVYRGSVSIVKHNLPRPYLRAGHLVVARYSTLEQVRESWEKQWFVLDAHRFASGIGLSLIKGNSHLSSRVKDKEEPNSDQYNIPIDQIVSIDRCLELALPDGYGFWIQTKTNAKGLYFLSDDLESANGWIDCLKLCRHITLQNKSQALGDILGP